MEPTSPEPWDSPGPLFDSVTWCDACGVALVDGGRRVEAMPVDCAAANAGSPATVCGPCWHGIRSIGGAA